LYGRDDIEVDLDSILFNSVASTISKWRTFKLLRLVQLFKRLEDLNDILYGGDGTAYYLDSILFNSVASTIPKWRTFKLLRSVQLLNRLVDLDEILYCGNGIKGDLNHSKIAVYLSVCPQLIHSEPLDRFAKLGTEVMSFKGISVQ
jgi:hypothetical protein